MWQTIWVVSIRNERHCVVCDCCFWMGKHHFNCLAELPNNESPFQMVVIHLLFVWIRRWVGNFCRHSFLFTGYNRSTDRESPTDEQIENINNNNSGHGNGQWMQKQKEQPFCGGRTDNILLRRHQSQNWKSFCVFFHVFIASHRVTPHHSMNVTIGWNFFYVMLRRRGIVLYVECRK